MDGVKQSQIVNFSKPLSSIFQSGLHMKLLCITWNECNAVELDKWHFRDTLNSTSKLIPVHVVHINKPCSPISVLDVEGCNESTPSLGPSSPFSESSS